MHFFPHLSVHLYNTKVDEFLHIQPPSFCTLNFRVNKFDLIIREIDVFDMVSPMIRRVTPNDITSLKKLIKHFKKYVVCI